MKYILVIGDGMADNPVQALGGLTPLEKANIPTIDRLASHGELGSVLTVPADFPPGSDTAILSIFGCAPAKCYSGRAPLEAAAQGIALKPGDAAFRCNNISVSDEDCPFEEKKLLSHSGGQIEGTESQKLVDWLFTQPEFKVLADKAGMCVNTTESYRHIAVQSAVDITGLRLNPPHDNIGKTVAETRPTGCTDADVLMELMRKANELLDHHPVNEQRRKEGKLPANAIWFWAEGTVAALPNFYEQYGHHGAVISAVPLCHGIATLTGLDVIYVDGATGELDTNFEGKVAAAIDAIDRYDFVAVHLEAPDECTHNNDLPGKLQAIEWLDSRIIAPIVEDLESKGTDFRMLILSDHKTLMESLQHDGDPVPYILYDSTVDTEAGMGYTEANGRKGPYVGAGTDLMPRLFSK